MRLAWCAILASLVAGCGTEQEARPEPVAQPSREPIVGDAQEMADWISEAMTSSGYEADFSIASAKEVDRFFDDQMARPGKPEPGGLLDEDLGQRLFGIAAYIGELIRRNSEGWQWVPAKDDPDDEINLSLRRGDEVIWPIQRVMKRYRNGSEDGIAAYVASVTAGTS
jgi:hypothetical protein